MRPRLTRYLTLGILAAAMLACNRQPGVPSPGDTPQVRTTTVTITAAGANPRNISVDVGTRVLFINNDSRAHNMTSDPHPDHTECPELNQVGFLAPGQSRETGNLVVARTCGYHDHDLPSQQSLQGQIVIK